MELFKKGGIAQFAETGTIVIGNAGYLPGQIEAQLHEDGLAAASRHDARHLFGKARRDAGFGLEGEDQ